MSVEKRIVMLNGIQMVEGYSDAEYRELLRKEYPPAYMGQCEICRYHPAVVIAWEGKRHCVTCHEKGYENQA